MKAGRVAWTPLFKNCVTGDRVHDVTHRDLSSHQPPPISVAQTTNMVEKVFISLAFR